MAEAPVKEVAAMSINSKEPAQANGNAAKPEAASPAPSSDGKAVSFTDQFKAFSKFGDVKSDGKFITLSQSDKWMKQAQVSVHFKNYHALFTLSIICRRLLTKK